MVDAGGWLSLDEAAGYLGMGKTVLYTMARENRIPSRKVGKKWMFEKATLDTWVRGSQPIESFFINLDVNIEGDNSLRDPQRDGYGRVYEYFHQGKNNAIVQLPVGCGKSGLASILPLGLAAGRVLVIAPNLPIKDELFDAMDITNRQKCFWRKTGVLRPEQMIAGPLACTLATSLSQRNATSSLLTFTSYRRMKISG